MSPHSILHPIIRPPEEHEIPQWPVRDDSATGPTEDLDREPDGVPHAVVGFTAFFSFLLAALVGVVFVSGGTTGHVAALLLAVVAVPVLVTELRNKAEHDRDHVHPAR